MGLYPKQNPITYDIYPLTSAFFLGDELLSFGEIFVLYLFSFVDYSFFSKKNRKNFIKKSKNLPCFKHIVKASN
jgi:hypothetical protein